MIQPDRETGYYWVQFPYKDTAPRWEPGSWDNEVKMWALIGSSDPWYEWQLQTIGSKIQGATDV